MSSTCQTQQRIPETPVWDRIPRAGDWQPPDLDLRNILGAFEPRGYEAFELLECIVDSFDALCFHLDILASQMSEHFADWQVAKIALMIDPSIQEMLDARNRGGSKTRDGTISDSSVCAAEPNTQAMWLSGNTFQLRQALSYARAIHRRTYMGTVFDVKTDRVSKAIELDFHNDSFMIYNASTATSGPRCNLLRFDEEGKITESNKIENNRNAMGMITGAKGTKRIRHSTTLSIGTPAQEVYERLEPLNLVFINYPEDCYWWTESDWELLEQYKLTMPRWWINCEYYSKLDAAGGRVFTHQHPLSYFDFKCSSPLQLGDGSVIEFTRPWAKDDVLSRTINLHWKARGGTDWNPSWGHTVVVAITDGTDWFVVDAYRGTNLRKMASFIHRWQAHEFWGKRWHYCAEQQGHLRTTQSRAETLRKMNIEIHNEENFNTPDQLRKLNRTEGLNENGCLHFATYVKRSVGKQAEYYRRDENTGLPAKKQEDHYIDALLHLVEVGGVKMEFSSNFGKWK